MFLKEHFQTIIPLMDRYVKDNPKLIDKDFIEHLGL